MGNGRGRWDRKSVVFRHRDALSEIGWQDFERVLADYYREQGYEVAHSGTGGRASAFDGGVDLRLRRDGKLTLVQCKHDNACQTEHNVVHELLGLKINEQADAAIVITSGEFTAAARRAGDHGHVQLIDGIEVRKMLGDRLARPPRAEPSRAEQVLERFAWQAVEHVATRSLPMRGRGAVDVTVGVIIGKAVFAILIFLFVVFVVPRVLVHQVQSLQPARPHANQPAPMSAPSPSVSVSSLEVQEPQSPAPLTNAQRKELEAEQARKAIEAQKYLERVPELTHYKYSPLDANKDPPQIEESGSSTYGQTQTP